MWFSYSRRKRKNQNSYKRCNEIGIEVKKKSNLDKGDIKSFRVIKSVLKQKCGEGAVICMADTYLPLSENVTIVPVGYL